MLNPWSFFLFSNFLLTISFFCTLTRVVLLVRAEHPSKPESSTTPPSLAPQPSDKDPTPKTTTTETCNPDDDTCTDTTPSSIEPDCIPPNAVCDVGILDCCEGRCHKLSTGKRVCVSPNMEKREHSSCASDEDCLGVHRFKHKDGGAYLEYCDGKGNVRRGYYEKCVSKEENEESECSYSGPEKVRGYAGGKDKCEESMCVHGGAKFYCSATACNCSPPSN